MPTLRNISPRGALDIPLIRRVVGRGETFECTPEQARLLLEQTDNFEAVKAATSKPKAAKPADTGGAKA